MKYLMIGAALVLAGCSKPEEKPVAVEKPGGYRIYVTNEISGDLSVIDSTTMEVVSTIPLGKRPRGIHPVRMGRLFMWH